MEKKKKSLSYNKVNDMVIGITEKKFCAVTHNPAKKFY